MTNANVKKEKERKKNTQKTNHTLKLPVTKNAKKHRGIKELLQKLY